MIYFMDLIKLLKNRSLCTSTVCKNPSGFTSLYCAQFFIKAYEVHYRLKDLSFGRFRGYGRLELKGNPVGKLSFVDYLAPTFS